MMSETNVSEFRKRYRKNPDGSTTMLRTRGGFPQFTTTDGKAPPAPIKRSLIGIFQAYAISPIDFPSSAFNEEWTATHAVSRVVPLSIRDLPATAKGNCEWFGDGPHVVSWFGLNGFGRQANSLFNYKASGYTRYGFTAGSGRTGMQREYVWVDGKVAFSPNSPNAVLCAGMSGDTLRVVTYTRGLVEISTSHAKDGPVGTSTSWKFTSPLKLWEITGGTAYQVGEISPVTPESGLRYGFVQSFFFDPSGNYFAGIVGYYVGAGSPMNVFVEEWEFSSATKVLNTKFGDEIERHGVESEPTPEIINTGLPVLSPAYTRNNWSPGGYGSARRIPVAVEYHNGALRILCKKIAEGSIAREVISRGTNENTVSHTEEEYAFLNVSGIADANLAARNAAYAAAGKSPPAIPDYYIAVYNGDHLPGEKRSGVGTVFHGQYTIPKNIGANYGHPEFVWALKSTRYYQGYDNKYYKTESYEVLDRSGGVVSDGYVRLSHVDMTRYLELWRIVSRSVDFVQTPRTISTSVDGTAIVFEVTEVTIELGPWEYNDSPAPDDNTVDEYTEEPDADDILAVDLRHDLYVVKQGGSVSMRTGFPTKSGWEPPFEQNLDDIEAAVVINELEKPLLGVSSLTTFHDGSHCVYAKTNPWDGGAIQLSYWNSGAESPLFDSPHEAPIFYRKIAET